jgi:hypothetical protein
MTEEGFKNAQKSIAVEDCSTSGTKVAKIGEFRLIVSNFATIKPPLYGALNFISASLFCGNKP